MDFGWLKKIFRKKNLSNTNTSDLATIDTSFIRAPKLSKLSKEEKEKVLEFYNKLKSGSGIDLVKYSNDLLEKANTEREMLLRAMSRYEEQYRFLEDTRKKYKQKQIPSIEIYNLGKLSSIEYSIIEKNIMNIRKELELKLVALDMYIKKEEKRNYNFLDVFGRAERIKCFTDKNKLLSERERLLTSIKIDENILTIIRKDIKDNQRLIIYHDLLKKLQNDGDTNSLRNCLDDSMYRLSKKSFFSIKEEYEDEVAIKVGNKMKGYPIREEAYNFDPWSQKYYILKETNGIIDEELKQYVLEVARHYGEDCTWKDFLDVVPDEFLDKLYEIVANYSHKRDLYVYEHRNDYKEYLQDMKELINKCETTSKEEWDSDLLKEKLIYYTKELKQCLNIYGNDRSLYFNEPYDEQISPPMEEQLRKNYFKLLFLYAISNGLDNLIFEIFNHSFYGDGLYLNIYIIYNEFVTILKELSVDVFNKYKVMPTFESKYNGDCKNEEKTKEILENGEFLLNILNGNYDKTKLYIGVYEDKNNLYNKISQRMKLVSYLNDYNNLRGISKKTFSISDEEPMEIEDLYYLLKIVGINKVMPYICFENLPNNAYLLSNIRWNKIEKEEDNRIFILPKQVRFNYLFSDQNKPIMTSLDKLNISDNNIAIYVSNFRQLNTIHNALYNDENNIKYLIMNEQLYEKYKERYDETMYSHIIIVPNDTRYVELSKYLDQELEIEHKQHKVLSKTL